MSLVFSEILSKHTASWHSLSSHLPLFFPPGTYYLTLIYLFVDLFECLSPPLVYKLSAPLVTTAPAERRQCAAHKRHMKYFLRPIIKLTLIQLPRLCSFHHIIMFPGKKINVYTVCHFSPNRWKGHVLHTFLSPTRPKCWVNMKGECEKQP